jgi:hypothetical protein
MPTEKVMHRTGQVLGTEKIPCKICKKETNQKVIYFSTRKATIAAGGLGIFGAVGGVTGALLGSKFNVNVPDSAFYGYVCNECKSLSIAKDWKDIKKKYSWSAFLGFKGKPKQDIEFKVWKLD